MEPNSRKSPPPTHSCLGHASNQAPRPAFLLAALLVSLLGLGGVAALLLKKHTVKPPSAALLATQAPQPATPESTQTQTEPASLEATVPPREPAVWASTNPPLYPAAAVPLPEPSAYTRQLVADLSTAALTNSPLSQERAAAWKQKLQALLQQGAGAVPAIQEFLAKNTDLNLGPDARQTLGYSSLRSAFIDALAQIGGPEAIAATLQVLQQTPNPSELATLAQNLEKLAPEQFRSQTLEAARQMLTNLAGGSPNDKDVAPVFEVLQRFGGQSAVSDLEQAGAPWKYYSAIALAQLPDGAGIPSLVRMAQGQEGTTTGAEDPALRMLAQLSAQYPDAREALLQAAQQNKIRPITWAAIAPILAGDQVGFQYSAFDGTATAENRDDLKTTHLTAGNQNFYSADATASLTADQVTQRVELIQKLLLTTTDPAALEALKRANDLLVKRLSLPNHSSP